ncbi:MAG: hypothetical protein HYV32_05320 [Candidatus Kerfeldbacteria bacterium]|nr:hypothetical protein [Candidatus Kerfeldbacteria bacterium]
MVEEIESYGFELLSYLGCGCFRTAILVAKDNKRFIAKIPIESQGSADNARELRIFAQATIAGDGRYFAKTQSVVDDSWILQEPVKPMPASKDLWKIFNDIYDKYDLADFLQVGYSLEDREIKIFDYGYAYGQ